MLIFAVHLVQFLILLSAIANLKCSFALFAFSKSFRFLGTLGSFPHNLHFSNPEQHSFSKNNDEGVCVEEYTVCSRMYICCVFNPFFVCVVFICFDVHK